MILGASAPLITKQLKHNSFTDIQAQLLNRKVEDVRDITSTNANNISSIVGTKDIATYAQYIQSLETKINNLESIINNENIQNVINNKIEQKSYDKEISSLQEQLDLKVNSSEITNKITEEGTKIKNEIKEELEKKTIPSGTIAFFDLATCPKNWSALSSTYAGRFPRFTGSFDVTNTSYAPTGAKTTTTTVTINKGTTGNDAIRNITGWYRGTDREGYGLTSSANGITGGSFYEGNWTGQFRATVPKGSGVAKDFYFMASKSVPTAVENRPRFIGLLGCRKN